MGFIFSFQLVPCEVRSSNFPVKDHERNPDIKATGQSGLGIFGLLGLLCFVGVFLFVWGGFFGLLFPCYFGASLQRTELLVIFFFLSTLSLKL